MVIKIVGTDKKYPSPVLGRAESNRILQHSFESVP